MDLSTEYLYFDFVFHRLLIIAIGSPNPNFEWQAAILQETERLHWCMNYPPVAIYSSTISYTLQPFCP